VLIPVSTKRRNLKSIWQIVKRRHMSQHQAQEKAILKIRESASTAIDIPLSLHNPLMLQVVRMDLHARCFQLILLQVTETVEDKIDYVSSHAFEYCTTIPDI
jgi:hypothetical protein